MVNTAGVPIWFQRYFGTEMVKIALTPGASLTMLQGLDPGHSRGGGMGNARQAFAAATIEVI
jgi:hypothetical protein